MVNADSDIIITTSIQEVSEDGFNNGASFQTVISFYEGGSEAEVLIGENTFSGESIIKLAEIIKRNADGG